MTSTTQSFLEALAIVLCSAALVAAVFRRLRQPTLVGYLFAGVLIGPHTPWRLISNSATLEGLSELGLILVMFSIGLEFTFRRLARVIPSAGLAGLIEISLMMWLGYALSVWLGLDATSSIFMAAMVAISSTTIVAKAFSDERVRERFTELVFGILLVEDLVAVILLAALATPLTGHVFGLSGALRAAGRLAIFLAALGVAGLLLIPRAIGGVARLRHRETLLVSSLGICFALAFIAHYLGYSSALGAFAAGTLIAESGQAQAVETLIGGVRDVFAAVFFVAVGMLIDPALIGAHWPIVLAFAALVMIGKFVGVASGSFLAGNSIRSSVRAGMSLGQIGEFSFTIGALGLTRHLLPLYLYSVIVAVSGLTAFVTPWFIRGSARVGEGIDRRLPAPLQTFAAFYAAWFERLRRRHRTGAGTSEIRRRFGWLMLDAAIIAAIVIVASVESSDLLLMLKNAFGLERPFAHAALVVGTLIIAAPFCLGLVNLAHRIAIMLATAVMPVARDYNLDLGQAPRGPLILAIQLGIVLGVSVPLLALTQPFLPPLSGAVVLALVVLLFGIIFWRAATGFEGHVRAGAQMVVEVLAAQSRADQGLSLDTVRQMLPGFESLTPVTVDGRSEATGKSLAELNLRAITGATVIAIVRDGQEMVIPTAAEVLRAGDVVALAGSEEAITAALKLIGSRAPGLPGAGPRTDA